MDMHPDSKLTIDQFELLDDPQVPFLSRQVVNMGGYVELGKWQVT